MMLSSQMPSSSPIRMAKRALLLLSVSAMPAVAFAQGEPADGDVNRDDIIVIATGYSVAGTSSRTDTPIIESPQTISVINRREMELRGVQTVSEAIAYTAGVVSEAGGTDSRVDEVTLRGFGAGGFSSNNSFADGLRLPSGGQWTRISFDPYALDQIEILKGPSSILFGQSAPGGVINMVSKRAKAQTAGEVVVTSTGFNDLGRWNYQGAVDFGGAINSDGTLSARIVGLARDGKTAINGVSNSRYYISPSITWQPNEGVELTLLGQYQRDEGGSTFQFLPMTGTLNPSNGDYIENDAFIGEPDWNVFDRNQYLLGAFLKAQMSEGLRFVANARYTKVDTLYRAIVLSGDTLTNCATGQGSTALFAGCIPGATVGRRGVQGVGDSRGIAVDTHFQGNFNTGPIEHQIVAGVDFSSTDWTHNRDNVSAPVAPILNIFDPVSRGATNFAASLTNGVHSRTQNDQTGVFLMNTMSIGGLRLTIGGRQDWAYDSTHDTISNRVYGIKTKDFTWRAGAVYLFDNGLAPYFNYATSFQPVTSDPTSNVDVGQSFKPMTGEQWEGGLRYQHGKNAYFTLSGFEITQQNMVSSIGGVRCGEYNVICNVQTGEVRFRGAEFEARVNTEIGLTLLGSVTRSWSKITESRTPAEVGNKFLGVPDWMASAFASYRFGGMLDGFAFGGGVRYTGESFGDNANSIALHDRTLFDAMLRYDFGNEDKMSFSVNARNLTDKRYVSTCTAASACFYGTGRTVTARLQYRW